MPKPKDRNSHAVSALVSQRISCGYMDTDNVPTVGSILPLVAMENNVTQIANSLCRFTVVLISSLFVASCNLPAIEGAPVGWGGTHRAVLVNEKSATYQYDPVVGGYDKVMEAASKHCSGFGKNAVPTQSGGQGVLRTQTFECK